MVRGHSLADTKGWTCRHIITVALSEASELFDLHTPGQVRKASSRGKESLHIPFKESPRAHCSLLIKAELVIFFPHGIWPPYQLLHWRPTTPEGGQAKPHRRSSFRISPSGFAEKFPVGIKCLHHRHHPPLLTMPHHPQKVFDLCLTELRDSLCTFRRSCKASQATLVSSSAFGRRLSPRHRQVLELRLKLVDLTTYSPCNQDS